MEAVDWVIRPGMDNGVSLDPYPFRKNLLEFSILARRLPKRLYGDDSDFQRALALTPYFAVKFTLHAANTAGVSQVAVA
jgi:hypothetical protein